MIQTDNWTETIPTILGLLAAAIIWAGWTLFSETRHNHGFWVAFLLPLSPIILVAAWIVYFVIKYLSYTAFLALGRPGDHDEFMRKIKIKSGIFLLF